MIITVVEINKTVAKIRCPNYTTLNDNIFIENRSYGHLFSTNDNYTKTPCHEKFTFYF